MLARTEHNNLHAGLIYTGTEGQVLHLHLGWHDYLATDWDWPLFWAAPDVEPEKLAIVAGHCRRIWRQFKKTPQLPYGLAYFGSFFDNNGRLILKEGARGLTCATFVLAVFKTAGIDLIDEASWPTRQEEAEQFLKRVVQFAEPGLYAQLHDEVKNGAKRIRPDEVLGACAITPLPASFTDTEPAAEVVLERLAQSA